MKISEEKKGPNRGINGFRRPRGGVLHLRGKRGLLLTVIGHGRKPLKLPSGVPSNFISSINAGRV